MLDTRIQQRGSIPHMHPEKHIASSVCQSRFCCFPSEGVEHLEGQLRHSGSLLGCQITARLKRIARPH
ncbi:hypothetical protein MTO96_016647 [Rhipicephalus appendiculatus]